MFHKVYSWTQDVTCFTVKSSLSVCAPEASSFHITLVYAVFCTSIGLQTLLDVTNHARSQPL